MKIISKSFLLSSAFSLVLPQTAFASLSSAYASLVDTNQNQAFESKPAHSFKLAAVHFITNDGRLNFGGSNPGGQEFLPSDVCKNNGYLYEGCPAGYIPGEACPEDSSFVKECIDPETWCKDNGYNMTSCTLPEYLSDKCPYSDTLYKSCEEDNSRACKDAGYSAECETGKIKDKACPYDSSYGTCVCNPCTGFAYTAAEASAQGYVPGEVCNSCGTMKYKRSEAPCDGFKTCDCGGATNAKTCWSGTTKKFDTCKECCDSKFQYDSSNCSGDYQLAGNSCGGKYDTCIKPGLILYSDRTTSRQYLPEKTAIGVVIDEDNKIAIAINTSNFNKTKFNQCVEEELKTEVDTEEKARQVCTFYKTNHTRGWGDDEQIKKTSVDIPDLEDCQDCRNFICSANNGKENTAKIIAYGKAHNLTFGAAELAYNFEPLAGCPSGSWCGKGNWYLPSMQELKKFSDNREIVKLTLKLIPGAQDMVLDIYNNGYSSSNEEIRSDTEDEPWSAACTMRVGFETGQSHIKYVVGTFVLPMIRY